MVTLTNHTSNRLLNSTIRDVVSRLLAHHGHEGAGVEIVIMEPSAIRELNRDYRHMDEATDVLTFPAPPNPLGHLGEIAINIHDVQRGADHRKVSRTHETTALAIHGALHLLGYDDVTEPQRGEMVRLMNDHLRRENMKVDDNWASLPHAEETP